MDKGLTEFVGSNPGYSEVFFSVGFFLLHFLLLLLHFHHHRGVSCVVPLCGETLPWDQLPATEKTTEINLSLREEISKKNPSWVICRGENIYTSAIFGKKLGHK